MTHSEIRNRLLKLAKARLQARLGAFEKLQFTLSGLPAGEALMARAASLPAPWMEAMALGLDKAAAHTDAHLLRVIDEWANKEAPARQIPALEGMEPLTAVPRAAPTSAAPVAVEKPKERRARWLSMFEAEQGRKKRGALQRLADSVGVDRSKMGSDIAKARAEREQQKQAGWTSQLMKDGKRAR